MIYHPHERLSEVWDIMRATGGSPKAMREAVESEFGIGLLSFSNNSCTVYLDTESISFWAKQEGPPDYAAATVRIITPENLDEGWFQACPIPLTKTKRNADH
jgi:hypothetical protein